MLSQINSFFHKHSFIGGNMTKPITTTNITTIITIITAIITTIITITTINTLKENFDLKNYLEFMLVVGN